MRRALARTRCSPASRRTFGGLGTWTLVDLILIAVGSFRGDEGKLVFMWTEPGSIG